MMNIERKPFGKTARGEAVTLFEIRTPELTARILDYGATVQALLVPDKNGKPVDVVLGHDTIEGYETHDGYLGACVGRVANRLGGAQFTLNGKTYILAKNDGKNHLHGGAGRRREIFPRFAGRRGGLPRHAARERKLPRGKRRADHHL